MKPLFIFALACAFGVRPPAAGQSAGPENRPVSAQSLSSSAKAQLKSEALTAFRSGDQAAGLAKVTASVSRGRTAPDENQQIGAQLAEISAALKSERNHVRATEVATLSLAQLVVARSKMKPTEAALSWTLSGQLCERILGNPNEAIYAYQQALVLDPKAPYVAERLAYLKAVEEKARARASENEVLRQRSAATKR